MIEYCNKQTPDDWIELTKPLTNINEKDFEMYKIKIDGVIFNNNSTALQDALAKANVWMTLSQ